MAQLLWDDIAENDLDDIWDYIGRQNQSPVSADRVITSLIEKARSYAEQPEMGTLHTDLGPDVRSFSVSNYIAFYQPMEKGIFVLRVIHGARDYPNLFGD